VDSTVIIYIAFKNDKDALAFLTGVQDNKKVAYPAPDGKYKAVDVQIVYRSQ
jgi:hypothetical protein